MKILFKYFVVFITSIFMTFSIFVPAYSALESLDDVQMGEISAKTGIDIVLPGLEMDITFNRISIQDEDGYFIISNKNIALPLKATYAQYLLGSQSIQFDEGKYYNTIDGYVDATYGNNNYTNPEFKPLKLDFATEGSSKSYMKIGLPTMQLIAKDLSDMSFRIGSSAADLSAMPLLTFNLPGLIFEGHGGEVSIIPHANGGYDLKLTNASFYWYNRIMSIRDSYWEGEENDHTLQLNKFLVHRGKGDYRPLTLNATIQCDTITLSGKTWLKVEMPSNTSEIYATLGQMKVCGTDFGVIETGQFHIGTDVKLYLSGHSNGMDAVLQLKLDADELKYTYGTGASDYNNAIKLHIAGTFSGTDTTPSTWVFTDTLKLGTLASPMRIDIYPSSVQITGTVQGSIGIENVQLGGTNFGPMLFSGVNVTYLKATIKK